VIGYQGEVFSVELQLLKTRDCVIVHSCEKKKINKIKTRNKNKTKRSWPFIHIAKSLPQSAEPKNKHKSFSNWKRNFSLLWTEVQHFREKPLTLPSTSKRQHQMPRIRWFHSAQMHLQSTRRTSSDPRAWMANSQSSNSYNKTTVIRLKPRSWQVTQTQTQLQNTAFVVTTKDVKQACWVCI